MPRLWNRGITEEFNGAVELLLAKNLGGFPVCFARLWAVTPSKKKPPRGIYERKPNQWYVRYADSTGRIRRELAGTKGMAIALYSKRKTEALQGRKLPETLRKRAVPFSELCDDAEKYATANNEGFKNDVIRIKQLRAEFGQRAAESIPIEAIRTYFGGQGWKDGTANRMRTVLFSIYRLGIENGKVSLNPAKLLKRKKVSDDRVRFLNQFEPLPTKVKYLKEHKTEEARLRAVIEHEFPEHMEAFDIALNTGLRSKEQFIRIDWSCVDLVRRNLGVPQSKNGKGRHIPLNGVALAAFESVHKKRVGKDAVRADGPIFLGRDGKRLQSAKHWFLRAVKKAGIADFTWHDLRHSFASRLVMADVNIRTVAELMGHRSLTMTMRYAHLAPEHNQVAVDRLNRYTS
jgi:integrase